jgi:hypothetical protein
MSALLDEKIAEYVELLRSGNSAPMQYLTEMVGNLDEPMTRQEYLELLVRAIFLRKVKDRIDCQTVNQLKKKIKNQNIFIISMFSVCRFLYIIKRFL